MVAQRDLRIVLVEDDPVDAKLQVRALRRAHRGTIDVTRVDRLMHLQAACSRANPDAILLDLNLPDARGLDTLRGALVVAGDIPVVVLTGNEDEQMGTDAVRCGAQDYVVKGTMSGPLLVKTILFAVERRQLNEQIRRAAFYDGLTGVPNRRLFMTRLRNAIARAGRSRSTFVLAFIDLDGFKSINDRFGHGVGDDVLAAVASRLSDGIRSEDMLCRLGGDEFAVIFERATATLALRMLERIGESVRRPLELANGATVEIELSAGIVEFPNEAESAESLLRQADEAMYLAKRKSREPDARVSA